MGNDLKRRDLRRELEQLRQENQQLRQGYASLSQRLIGLRMLQHITRDLVSELDVDRLLKRILRSAIQAAEATAGTLFLLDSSGDNLIFAVVEGGGGEALRGQRLPRDRGIVGWCLSHNQPVIIADVREDERFYGDVLDDFGFGVRSMICVPMLVRGEVIGAIQVLNKAHGPRFDDDDLDLMVSFTAQSAAAIENARLYQELKRERDRIIAVEEEIRRRLARDLHDGPAQLLAAIIVNIEFVQKLLDREPHRVLDELDNLIPLAQKALRQLRTLLFDLRPVILETQGLVPALESYVRRQEEVRDLDLHLQVRGFSGRLVTPAERAIFGIVQEAVGNVRKHAQARNVWISLATQNGDLCVEVRDDGQGFDVARVEADYDQRGSLGMLNMQERAETIDGELAVHSAKGEGTSISLTVPLSGLWELTP